MGSTEHKPVKIKLNNNTASGMYILLAEHEIKYTKENETRPPNRKYKIQINVEAVYGSKRCTGKKQFNINRGTSISKAVSSLLGKREEIREILRSRGTLKLEKKIFKQINTKDRTFKSVYEAWISGKEISTSQNTVKNYNGCYNGTLHQLDKKVIDDITEDDVQNIITGMINDGKKPKTIHIVKIILKPLLELNDVHLNWKKITLPKIEAKEKFSGSDEQAILITKTLLNYSHPIARAVFTFLLTGRRIGEVMLMEHKHINYKKNTFTLPKENTKTNTEVTFPLTPALINAIKSQKTTTGKIFNLENISIHYHFKKAMRSIGIHNMVMHDIRSMVAVVSLRNGADIYSVSKMLAHKQLSTTEANYLGDGVERAVEAQETFTAVIGASDETIDVEILEDEYETLKKLYPHASDDKIKRVMEIMKD